MPDQGEKKLLLFSSARISLSPDLGPLREKEINKIFSFPDPSCMGFLANRRQSAGYQITQVIKK